MIYVSVHRYRYDIEVDIITLRYHVNVYVQIVDDS